MASSIKCITLKGKGWFEVWLRYTVFPGKTRTNSVCKRRIKNSGFCVTHFMDEAINLRMGQRVKNLTKYEHSIDVMSLKFLLIKSQRVELRFQSITSPIFKTIFEQSSANIKMQNSIRQKKSLMRCKYYRFFICYK